MKIRLEQRSAGPFIALVLSSLIFGIGFCASAYAQPSSSICGGLRNSFGPYDYRDQVGSTDYKNNPNNPLFLVESAHFRVEMEALIRGGQGERSDVGPEFDYTLRAFPIHHKALEAMIRLGEKQHTDQPKGARYTIDCWFERATRFQPSDAIVRMIYAIYLGKQKRLPDAMKQLEMANDLAKENGFTHYNIGLIYLDLKEPDRALEQAHIAYALGMQHTELREKLTRSGHWRESVPLPSSQPASAPAAPQ